MDSTVSTITPGGEGGIKGRRFLSDAEIFFEFHGFMDIKGGPIIPRYIEADWGFIEGAPNHSDTGP